ncbi:hypothetical protein NDA18_002149 [Ustilago nuda]|nr:hypothetical protein NDA18_002149 [Ustilago nuda]
MHSASPSCRKRILKRGTMLIVLPLALILLFAVIFFPVYFTRHRSTPSSSNSLSTGGTSSTESSIRSRTTPGAVWVQNANFKDLDDLRIDYYSSGQVNSKVLVAGLPSNVWSDTPPSLGLRDRGVVRRQVASSSSSTKHPPSHHPSTTRASNTETTPNTPSTLVAASTSPQASSSPSPVPAPAPAPRSNGSSVLQIFYPAQSYTPSELPVGGTQFYASTPFLLSLATSVTFNYSVFFPLYYDFVLGGKLPGLYGGTEGCGGGNNAEHCWSSRMAWRSGGLGELYAYLPQHKQNTSAMLDVKPYSYVNPVYGISLGRGSFNLTKGAWTNISQTITLQNNETHPNGVFHVSVNGESVIHYDQVFFPTWLKGILFSTFFGGSTREWATPVDQFSYFAGFSVSINSVES